MRGPQVYGVTGVGTSGGPPGVTGAGRRCILAARVFDYGIWTRDLNS
jgi:hypothetical protein